MDLMIYFIEVSLQGFCLCTILNRLAKEDAGFVFFPVL